MQGIHAANSAAQPPQHLSHVPVNANANANGAGGNGSVTQAAAGNASSTSLVAHSSTTVTFVTQQVDMMLANISGDLGNQQTLRLMIALLILQELLGNGNGNGNGNGSAAELLGLLNGNGNGNGGNGNGNGGNGNGNSASLAALSSQTTMMQVHHEQTLAYHHQSAQGAAVSQYTPANANLPSQNPHSTDVTV